MIPHPSKSPCVRVSCDAVFAAGLLLSFGALAQDHAHHQTQQPAVQQPAQEHVRHSPPQADTEQPRTPIPEPTDADRAAAVKPAGDHAVHDDMLHAFFLLDRLEAWDADRGTGMSWEAQGWVGTDRNRLWLRSEGERVGGTTETADLEVLYGRPVSAWWDVVGGLRHEFGEGHTQTFAAIGVQGMAPYKFEVEATAYLGQSGQAAARLEVEYDTLLTNRLILQWQAEAEFYAKDDAERGIGSGLNTVEAGLRLRYEIRREFAPYVGVSRERVFGDAADSRTAHGEDIDDTRIVAGVRIWF